MLKTATKLTMIHVGEDYITVRVEHEDGHTHQWELPLVCAIMFNGQPMKYRVSENIDLIELNKMLNPDE